MGYWLQYARQQMFNVVHEFFDVAPLSMINSLNADRVLYEEKVSDCVANRPIHVFSFIVRLLMTIWLCIMTINKWIIIIRYALYSLTCYIYLCIYYKYTRHRIEINYVSHFTRVLDSSDAVAMSPPSIDSFIEANELRLLFRLSRRLFLSLSDDIVRRMQLRA